MKGEYGEPWDRGTMESMHPVQGARAVACVNALDGMDPEKLAEFVEAAVALIRESEPNDEGASLAPSRDAVDRLDRAAAALGVGK